MFTPASIDELLETVRSTPRLLAVGAQTKDRLCAGNGEHVSLARLSGITEYEPAEYTFTALAGTSLEEVIAALRARGQYLPFDPMLAEAGATLGGTVAAGFSGPRRFRYGGIRDFLLGIRFVNGAGELLTAGAKVVKNAAGFDLPKLFVGSLGTLGILTELTFKVFPEPASNATIGIACKTHDQASRRMMEAAAARWELDALDYRASEKRLYLRVQGSPPAVDALAASIVEQWPSHAHRLLPEQADRFWGDVNAFRWVPNAPLWAKVIVTPKSLPPLLERFEDLSNIIDAHVSAGGAVVWLAANETGAVEALHSILSALRLSGLIFKGSAPRRWLGILPDPTVTRAVKRALDPGGKFPCIT